MVPQQNSGLVLSRKTGEEIILVVPPCEQNNIHIFVDDIGPGRIKTLISAQKEVGIFRSEIFEQSTRMPLPTISAGALVLSRKAKEEIVLIPQQHSATRFVVLVVASIEKNKTRLAFTADRSILVFRREVLDRIEQDRQTIVQKQ